MIILDSLSRCPKGIGTWRGGERGSFQSISPTVGGLMGSLDTPLPSGTGKRGACTGLFTSNFGVCIGMGRAPNSLFFKMRERTHVLSLSRGTEKSKGGCRRSKKLLTSLIKIGLCIFSPILYYVSLLRLFHNII